MSERIVASDETCLQASELAAEAARMLGGGTLEGMVSLASDCMDLLNTVDPLMTLEDGAAAPRAIVTLNEVAHEFSPEVIYQATYN